MRNHAWMIGLVFVASCATTFQPRAGKVGVYCSESRMYAVVDFAIAAALLYAASEAASDDSGGGETAGLYVPSGVFALSGVHGLVKRSNCVNYRREAPPEAWSHDLARKEADDAQTSALVDAAVTVGGAVIANEIANEQRESRSSSGSSERPTRSYTSSSSSSSSSVSTSTSRTSSNDGADWSRRANECRARCDADYASLKSTCASRWSDAGCRDESCRTAAATAYVQCASSSHYVTCTNACR